MPITSCACFGKSELKNERSVVITYSKDKVNAGEVLTIPPHMPHRAEAMVDTVDLDVFNPPRADWINKTDQYLRGGK